MSAGCTESRPAAAARAAASSAAVATSMAGSRRASLASAMAESASPGISPASSTSSGSNCSTVGSARPCRISGTSIAGDRRSAMAAAPCGTGRRSTAAARPGASSSTGAASAREVSSRRPRAPAVSAGSTTRPGAPGSSTGMPRFSSDTARCTARSRRAAASGVGGSGEPLASIGEALRICAWVMSLSGVGKFKRLILCNMNPVARVFGYGRPIAFWMSDAVAKRKSSLK